MGGRAEMMAWKRRIGEGLRRRVKDPFYQNTTSIFAMENDQVLGRIGVIALLYDGAGRLPDGVCGLGLWCCRKPDIKALRGVVSRRWKDCRETWD